MQIIKQDKRSHVYFDEQNDTYIKLFFPSFSKKIKYFFRLRKYPGYNFKYISDRLNKLGINTPSIIKYDKYSVTTKNIKGVSLEKYIKNDYTHPIIDDFIKIITIILKHRFFYGDFSLDNFIVKNNKIYAIDLEDYRKEFLFAHSIHYTLKRMKGKMPDAIIEKIKKEVLK